MPSAEIWWTLIIGTVALLTLSVVFIVTIIANQRRFVTIEREKLDALKKSEQRFRSLIENSFDVITLFDADGTILFSSESTFRVLGYTPEELRQLPRGEFIGAEELKRIKNSFEHHQDDGQPVHFQFRVRHRGGSLRWLEGIATNLLSEPSVNAIVVNYRDITERKKAEEKLRNSHDQLRKLAARLQTAREEERTHIAREIHDELGQMMTVLKLDLALLSRSGDPSPETTDAIQSMSALIDTVIHSIRRIATELRPDVLEDLGLIEAFEWELETFQKRTGIETAFLSNVRELALERDRATALFRIFQEALTNIARHAHAGEVAVHVIQQNGELTLEVQDNGNGISDEDASGLKSLGLLGMKERAIMIGGELLIKGENGKGTLVRVRVPLSSTQNPTPYD
jgi:PAS domain S-box-containing protein